MTAPRDPFRIHVPKNWHFKKTIFQIMPLTPYAMVLALRAPAVKLLSLTSTIQRRGWCGSGLHTSITFPICVLSFTDLGRWSALCKHGDEKVIYGGTMSRTKESMNPPGPIQIVDQELLSQVSLRAKNSPRKRMNYNLHQVQDRVQRMLNGLEPETYICPHRHIDPPKVELFIILRGKMAALFFDDHGAIDKCLLLTPGGLCAVDVPIGAWHSIVALEPGTVMFEAKDGPYVPATDKDFAPWAPREGEPEVAAYLAWMRDQVKKHALSADAVREKEGP
jgi:cupin fold WbuC family metalloprotein